MQKKKKISNALFCSSPIFFLCYSSEHWPNLTLLSFHSTLILEEVINRVTALSRMELAEFSL